MDSRGRYWVLFEGPPLVFDGTGEVIHGAVIAEERQLQRPSEAINLPADSVLVLDAAGKRAVIYDGELRVIRTIEYDLPALRGVAVRWPDKVILAGPVPTPAAAGYALHIASFAGPQPLLARSFGGSGAMLYGASAALRRTLRDDGHGGYWTAEVGRYRVAHRSLTDEEDVSLSRRPTWFQGTDGPRLGGPTLPPSSVVAGFDISEDSVLWVFSRVARSDWRKAWPENLTGLNEIAITGKMLDQLYYTVIEAIDLRTHEILATQSLDLPVLAVLPGPRAVSRLGSGYETLQVLQVSLRR